MTTTQGRLDKRLRPPVARFEQRVLKYMAAGLSRVEATRIAELPKRQRKAYNGVR